MTKRPRSFGHITPKGTPRPSFNGVKFRSKSECAVAKALETLEWEWEYEPQEFEFVNIRRGNRFYRPDFKAWRKGAPEHYRWIEVKGYFDAPSLTKLRRFARYYPHEACRLTLITDSKIDALFTEPCFRSPLDSDDVEYCPAIWRRKRMEKLGGGE